MSAQGRDDVSFVGELVDIDDDDDDGGVVPHGRRFSLSDRGMAAMAESLLRHCCRCHRLRPLSGVALRRGGVRTTGDEVLSARGCGDCDIVAGELVGACRSSRPDNSYTTVVAGRTALRVSTLTYREYPYLKPSPPCEIVKNRALWLRQEALGSRLFPFVIFEQVAMTT